MSSDENSENIVYGCGANSDSDVHAVSNLLSD